MKNRSYTPARYINFHYLPPSSTDELSRFSRVLLYTKREEEGRRRRWLATLLKYAPNNQAHASALLKIKFSPSSECARHSERAKSVKGVRVARALASVKIDSAMIQEKDGRERAHKRASEAAYRGGYRGLCTCVCCFFLYVFQLGRTLAFWLNGSCVFVSGVINSYYVSLYVLVVFFMAFKSNDVVFLLLKFLACA